MSMLHQNPQEPLDDAALGEDLTRGTSHVVWAALIATILVSIGIVAYFIHGQKPPAAAGEILQVWAHPIHTETSGVDANGDPMAKESYDQMLVFARVRLHNQSKDPILLASVLCNITLEDGIHSSYVASPAEYERVFHNFTGLDAMHGTPLASEQKLLPGQSVEGYVVSAFRLPRAQWEQRKDLNFTFGFRYQPVLKLLPQGAVVEQ
jgi:hypothetical protein